MPSWLIALIVILAVVPGAAVILAGVYAMFVSSDNSDEPDRPAE